MDESLSINFADRDDVLAKLPHARRIRDTKEQALRAAQGDWQVWVRYVAALEDRAGVDSAPGDDRSDSAEPPMPSAEPTPEPVSSLGPMDLVVEVVERENRKLRAKEVRQILHAEGHDLTSDAVSNALFYAAKRAKPSRIKAAMGRGFYAPMSYVEPPTTGYGVAASNGFPAPDHSPAAPGSATAG